MALVAPHGLARAAEPRLYFVGDVEPACGVDDLDDRSKEAGRLRPKPIA